MRALCKVVDSMLLFLCLQILVAVPLVDSQILFPQSLYPDIFVRINKRFVADFQHYLLVMKPRFYVALIWLALVFLWPLALLNVYGILASKPWFNSTCLLFGATLVTTAAPILGEILGSPMASVKLLMMYFSVMGFGILAILRGLLLQQSHQSGQVTASVTKKRA